MNILHNKGIMQDLLIFGDDEWGIYLTHQGEILVSSEQQTAFKDTAKWNLEVDYDRNYFFGALPKSSGFKTQVFPLPGKRLCPH